MIAVKSSTPIIPGFDTVNAPDPSRDEKRGQTEVV